MSHAVLPKYFVSHAAPETQVCESLPPSHVLDTFYLGNRHLAVQEWIVATDIIGNLIAWPDGERASLPETIQSELTFFEMTGQAPKRTLHVSEVFLFYLQLLEQPGPAPGFNDPIYLYGTLFGPFPNAAAQPPCGIAGQLTITRADLLEALVQNARYASRYAPLAGATSQTPHCFQFLLPADREDELAQGRGLVLAYPLLPPELILNAVNNEQFVKQLAYDVLSALREDLLLAGLRLPLCEKTLPVPSRAQLEQDLQAEGYEIKGNTARKQFQAKADAQGWLRAIFGSLTAEQLELPPEGSIEDFINLAAQTLAQLPDWPSPRALALRQRVSLTPPTIQQPTHVVPSTFPASAPAPQALPSRVPQKAANHEAWIQDFIAAHQTPGQPAPRLTTTRRVAASAAPEAPLWQQDFAPPPPSTRSSLEAKAKPAKQPQTPPDWMEDFE